MEEKAAASAVRGDTRARQHIWNAALYWAHHIGQKSTPKAPRKRKKGQPKG